MFAVRSGRAYLAVMLVQAACGIVCVLSSAGFVGLGWLALAAIPGIVATRTWGRRIIGSALIVASVLALLIGGWVPVTAAALGCLLTGVVTVVLGPTWPTMGSRYERVRSERSAWQTLDAGEDPTLRDD